MFLATKISKQCARRGSGFYLNVPATVFALRIINHAFSFLLLAVNYFDQLAVVFCK